MEISPKTTLFDLLDTYPFLEDKIIGVAPPFKNLKNPVLRRTVGRLATIEKVAEIGGINVTRFVNTLRQAVGQTEIQPEGERSVDLHIPRTETDPEWIANEPEYTLNGTAILESGEIPLLKVNDLLAKLSPSGYLLLVTNFEPTPILEAMQKQNRRLFYKRAPENNQHLTFIQ